MSANHTLLTEERIDKAHRRQVRKMDRAALSEFPRRERKRIMAARAKRRIEDAARDLRVLTEQPATAQAARIDTTHDVYGRHSGRHGAQSSPRRYARRVTDRLVTVGRRSLDERVAALTANTTS